jgi:membrane fusion protein, adhesin transport system
MSVASHTLGVTTGHPDSDRGPNRVIHLTIAVVVDFFIVAIAWSALATLDVSVHARGAVVPPSRLQEIQSLEGGIVQELLVKPGQHVSKGAVLVRLDSAQFDADLGESSQNRVATLLALERVDSLLRGTEPRFDPKLVEEAPELAAKERQLWSDAIRSQRAGLTAAQEAARRQAAELAEANARIVQLRASVKLAEDAYAIEERLFKEGAGSRADYVAAQQRLLAQRGELDAVRGSIPRLEAALSAARASASEVDARARAQWGALRTELGAKAGALESTVAGRQDRVTRRELVSPVDGVVNRVLIPTLGGVATAGKPILEIVPDDAQMLINVRVLPNEIGFIHPGQEAKVQVLPYDPSIYGRLSAKVERVGADAVVNERGEAYFEVQLVSSQRALTHAGKTLPISPGMPVDAGIVTGERTVLQYLLKPVLRGIDTALQER